MAAVTGSRVSRRILTKLAADKTWILPGLNFIYKSTLKIIML
jgi:hypothetical protein